MPFSKVSLFSFLFSCSYGLIVVTPMKNTNVSEKCQLRSLPENYGGCVY